MVQTARAIFCANPRPLETASSQTAPASSIVSVDESTSTVSIGEKRFFFDAVVDAAHVGLPAKVYADACQSSGLISSVVSGRTGALVTFGANSSKSSNNIRDALLLEAVKEFQRELDKIKQCDTTHETALSFACIGLNDNRAVNLLTDKTIPEGKLDTGFQESFFEPCDDCTDIIQKIRTGISMPGYVMAIKMERIATRTILSIEKEMERNQNVYHAMANLPSTQVGMLVLANLGLVSMANGDVTKLDSDSMPSLNRSMEYVRSIVARLQFSKLPESIKIGDFSFTASETNLASLLLPTLFSANTLFVLDGEVDYSTPSFVSAMDFVEMAVKVKHLVPMNRFDDRGSILGLMEKQYNLLKRRHSDMMAEYEAAEKCLAEFREQMVTTLHDRDMLSAEKSHLEDAVEALKAKVQEISQQFNELQKEKKKMVDEKTRELEGLEKAKDQVEKEKTSLEKANEEMIQKMNQLEINLMNASEERDGYKSKLDQYEKDLENEKKKVGSIEAKYSDAKNDLSSMSTMEAEMKKLRKERDSLLKQVKELESSTEESTSLLQRNVDKLKAERKELIERIADAELKLESKEMLETTKKQKAIKEPIIEQQDVEEVKQPKKKAASSKKDVETIVQEDSGDEIMPKKKRVPVKKTVDVSEDAPTEIMDKDVTTQNISEPNETKVHKRAKSKVTYIPESGAEESDDEQFVAQIKEQTAKRKAPSAKSQKKSSDDRKKVDKAVTAPVEKKKRKLFQAKRATSDDDENVANISNSVSSEPKAAPKVSAPTIPAAKPKGIINPAALQMIKAGFTLPKLLKK